MPESESFWNFYWEVRLQAMETLGKREAILTASRLIRQISAQDGRVVRLLEPGCGEGQIIGTLVEGHAQVDGIGESVGIDYYRPSIEAARRSYPGMHFIEGDFTDPALLSGLGSFEIVLLVNALHEVFSTTYSETLGQVDVPAAKMRVEQALAESTARMAPGGYLVLFDGLEPPGSPDDTMRIRFLDSQARAHFETFAREYHPFHIHYREAGSPYRVELSRHDFARYITKSIFLGKQLWKSERFESYQYFTEAEFRAALSNQGLQIRELRKLTVNDGKWNRFVEIETPGEDFPAEHILIVAQKPFREEASHHVHRSTAVDQ